MGNRSEGLGLFWLTISKLPVSEKLKLKRQIYTSTRGRENGGILRKVPL
jgi:hypothetical protein